MWRGLASVETAFPTRPLRIASEGERCVGSMGGTPPPRWHCYSRAGPSRPGGEGYGTPHGSVTEEVVKALLVQTYSDGCAILRGPVRAWRVWTFGVAPSGGRDCRSHGGMTVSCRHGSHGRYGTSATSSHRHSRSCPQYSQRWVC